MPIDLNQPESRSAEMQHDTADSLVTNEEIRTTPENVNWNLFVMTGENDPHQFFARPGTNEELGRSPHLEPGMVGQELIPLGDLGEIFE
jgi:hypothetical protein